MQNEHGGSNEMNIMERVYDDENKQKGPWRTTVKKHPFLHSQLEIQSNGTEYSVRRTRFSRKTFVWKLLLECFYSSHTERLALAPNQNWNGLQKKRAHPLPHRRGSFVIDLWQNFTIQNYLHRFIWLLLITLLTSAVQMVKCYASPDAKKRSQRQQFYS